jgi:hypothetical protein
VGRGRLTPALLALPLLLPLLRGVAPAEEPAAGAPLAVALFDEVWAHFDAVYPYFEHKRVDWDAFRERHRPAFEAPLSPAEFARALAAALAELRDRHVHVIGPDGVALPVYVPDVLPAQTFTFIPRVAYSVGGYETLGVGGGWHGWLEEDVAYIRIDTLLDGAFAEVGEAGVDALFERYAGARGLLLDLRPNAGGNEDVGRWFASRVVDAERPYGFVRYRGGPGRAELGDTFVKTIAPAGEHRFLGPVAVLIGPRNMSSTEWLILMLASAPHVTLVGAPTSGSSGNPELVTLQNGVTFGVPRWFAMRPDGRPLEDTGIEPDVLVPAEASFDAAHDHVVERALALLRRGFAPAEAPKPVAFVPRVK